MREEQGEARREDEAFLREQILTYLGNKRALLAFIGEGVARVQRALGRDRLSTFDIFSGSGVVARSLKAVSERLYVCDLEGYSEVVNRCYLKNRDEVDGAALRALIAWVNEEAERRLAPGPISALYAPRDDDHIQPGERAFYTRRNAMMIDTVRRLISDEIPPPMRPLVLAPLLYVASVHANTSGVFKSYYKDRATGLGQFGGSGRDALSRITKPFQIPVPLFSRYRSEVTIYRGDANAVAGEAPLVDLAYLDPPYNQHPYGSNYFMLNLIAEGRRPEVVSPVAGIPPDWQRSVYNQRRHALAALRALVHGVRARFLLVSYNSEGFIERDALTALLAEVGPVERLEQRYNTFRAARNLSARPRHVTEYLFLVDKRGALGGGA